VYPKVYRSTTGDLILISGKRKRGPENRGLKGRKLSVGKLGRSLSSALKVKEKEKG